MVMLNDYRVRAIMKVLEDERKLNLVYIFATNLPERAKGTDEGRAAESKAYTCTDLKQQLMKSAHVCRYE